MGIKAVIAARLDARYVRKQTVERLARDIAQLRDQVITAQSHAKEAQTDAKAAGVELRSQRTKLDEAHRLATEASRAIEPILREEIRHAQLIDGLTGDGL